MACCGGTAELVLPLQCYPLLLFDVGTNDNAQSFSRLGTELWGEERV